MQQPPPSELWHGTTILTVRKGGVVAIGGDGQVSIGQTIVKANAKKVRRLAKGDVIGGFAGATADAFTLFERLEAKLEQYPGQLTRAAVELAKDWRTDRYLRRLEAMMIVADKDVSLVLTGTGDVLEPEVRRHGHRLGRQLCARRRARAGRRPARCRSDRAQVARHRGRHLRLHQPQRHRRDVEGLRHGARVLGVYEFRPMTAADLPLIRRWLATPHVAEWWDDPLEQFELVSGDLGASRRWSSSSLRRTSGRSPICNATTSVPGTLASARSRTARAASISSSAKPDMIDRGHGSAFIRVFADDLLANGTPRVVIDPDPGNARAIRAYEKAGFCKDKLVDTPDGVALLMVRNAGTMSADDPIPMASA